MAFKMKGSPMQRNFGIGGSPMKGDEIPGYDIGDTPTTEEDELLQAAAYAAEQAAEQKNLIDWSKGNLDVGTESEHLGTGRHDLSIYKDPQSYPGDPRYSGARFDPNYIKQKVKMEGRGVRNPRASADSYYITEKHGGPVGYFTDPANVGADDLHVPNIAYLDPNIEGGTDMRDIITGMTSDADYDEMMENFQEENPYSGEPTSLRNPPTFSSTIADWLKANRNK